MAENTPKDPPLQTMSGLPPNHNPWLYNMYHQYNGYHGGMYPQFYNHQYYNQMGPHGYNNDVHQLQQSNDSKFNFGHPQFNKPPPPLLGMSPMDSCGAFTAQSPIRFNLNGNRKTTPIPPIENPLLNNNPKKKRKKGINSSDQMGFSLPPLPDHPPPLPPCPPPDVPKPPPPPLDVPLPPPLATEDIPEPIEGPQCDSNTEQESESYATNDSEHFLKFSPMPTSAGTWPESLERYIKRCYEKCKTGFDRDQIDICLKGRITAAANKDEIWTRNWDEEPIPSVHSERNNLSVKPVRGTLALYQKSENTPETNKTKQPLSARIFNNHKNSSQRRRKTHSESRSKSRSPSRKRHSISPGSGDEVEDKKVKNRSRQKIKDRLSFDQKRQDKFQKNAKKKSYNQFIVEDVNGNAEKLQKRAERFGKSEVPSIASSLQANRNVEQSPRNLFVEDTEGDYELNNMHIVGTCMDIEKPFLRLTRAPEPCEVRPAYILKRAFAFVKERWMSTQDYRYTCDQLKSIRQDLTVQGIRDCFSIDVYETHARIALEKGDHEEFNQCQTQLIMLYVEVPGGRRNYAEFTAYRILYYIFTKNTLDLTTIFQFLSKEDRKSDCIKHALNIRGAWATGNLHKFFLLYKLAPYMGGYLMDWFVERERKQYLKYIIKSYRQAVPVDFIQRELAFDSLSKTFEFLNQFPLSYTDSDQTQIDCKLSLPALSSI